MEDHAVVEPFAGEEEKVVDGLRSLSGEKLHRDVAQRGVQRGAIAAVEVDGDLGSRGVLLGQGGAFRIGKREP